MRTVAPRVVREATWLPFQPEVLNPCCWLELIRLGLGGAVGLWAELAMGREVIRAPPCIFIPLVIMYREYTVALDECLCGLWLGGVVVERAHGLHVRDHVQPARRGRRAVRRGRGPP